MNGLLAQLETPLSPTRVGLNIYIIDLFANYFIIITKKEKSKGFKEKDAKEDNLFFNLKKIEKS